jgi:probable rRNA maturation factor
MINIDVLEKYASIINQNSIINTAAFVVQQISHEKEVDLSIVVTSDAVIQDLNYRFRDLNSPTDVLSFPSAEIDPENGRLYIGDVIISYPRVIDQAQGAAHSIEDELLLLVVHGILHLLGFDHNSPHEKNRMWTKQANILNTLGCVINKFPE